LQPPLAGRTELAALPGWAAEDHAAAFAAFVEGCRVVTEERLRAVCARARGQGALVGPAARAFMERFLVAETLAGEGLLTGYYAPEYPARTQPDAEFSAPVRPMPADLLVVDQPSPDPLLPPQRVVGRMMDGQFQPYPARVLIERRATRRTRCSPGCGRRSCSSCRSRVRAC
jgi:membrane-bound lytic murein transglycosylase A